MNDELPTFPDMPSIDLDATLQRLMGRKDLLWKVMKAFAATSIGTDHQLRGFFLQQDVQSAQGLAHRIKGSAANMGAVHLSAVAAEIEQQLKQGVFDTPQALLTQYEEALHCVLRDISSVEAGLSVPGTDQSAAQTLDRAAVDACSKAIVQYIRTDLGRVQQELKTLTTLTRGSELQKWSQEINLAFDQFKLLDVARLVNDFMADPVSKFNK